MRQAGPTYLVGVPTYRRPESARRLLDALVGQLETVPSAAVLLIDNDPSRSAAGLAGHPVLQHDGGGYRHEPTPGLATVRNAALRAALAAGATFLVFIDDDEVPETGWLAALAQTQSDHEADVVAGPVRQLPQARRRPAVRALLDREEHPQGRFDGDIGAGNALVRMDFVRRHSLSFDPSLNHSGGEDTLFFREARLAGAVVAWAADAVALEHNDPERLTLPALVRRTYRQGRTEHRISARTGDVRRLPVRLSHFSAAGPWITLRIVTAALRGHQEDAWRQIFRLCFHAGRLRGAGAEEVFGQYGIGSPGLPTGARRPPVSRHAAGGLPGRTAADTLRTTTVEGETEACCSRDGR